jgi:hypothetical protein
MIWPLPASRSRYTAAIVVPCIVVCLVAASRVAADGSSAPNAPSPAIRRIYVPADLPALWPTGDWQPIPLHDLERQLDAANAARMRPAPFIEHAQYSARFTDGALHDGQFSWSIQRPTPAVRLLSLGELNLNLDGLTWTGTDLHRLPGAVVCGISPQGSSVLLVEGQTARLNGQWNLEGRRLATSTEFDFQLAPAAMSQLRITVPAGMLVSNSAGESPRPLQTSEAGWTEWQVRLGSRTHARVRIAQPPDAAAARPLNVARSSVSYRVRSEDVRLFAEFELEVLESSLRELRLQTDPEIQVTSIDYGDGGVVSWRQLPSDRGPVLAVQLPDPISGPAPTLQIQAISQIKQFGPWVLPRIVLQNFVEADSKVTLRLQPPFAAADIRSDGYRQLSLTTGIEGESMLYRQMQPGATITIVPAETKPELACRVISLLQADRGQCGLITQLEWSASAGGTYSVTCRIPPLWEIIDVRSTEPASDTELTGREVEETASGERLLHVFFRNALNASRPQRFRVTARHSPPAPGELIVVPVVIPVDAGAVEQFTIVATGPETRPVVDSTPTLEQIGVRALAADVRNVDFLAARLTDRSARFQVLRSVGATDGNGLRIEVIEPNEVASRIDGALESSGKISSQEPRRTPNYVSGEPVFVSLSVTARISGTSSGFDECRAELRAAAWDGSHPLRFRLDAPAELMAVSVEGHRLATVADQRVYTITAPGPEASFNSPGNAIVIEYRVPAGLRRGLNSRKLLFPVAEGEILRFDLALIVPEHLRLVGESESLPLVGLPGPSSWWRRLLGPFARPDSEPLFNPFDLASWNRLAGDKRHGVRSGQTDRIYRSAAATMPGDVHIVLWQESEVAWLTIAALALCALAGVLVRMGQFRGSRAAGSMALASLCGAALILPAVEAEIAAGAVVGLVLAALLPQKFLQRTGGLARHANTVPAESTQSFLPIGIVLLAVGVCWFRNDLHAQESRVPKAAKARAIGTLERPIFDVLIPVDASGKPAGKSPIGYISREIADYLRNAAATDALPAYLIGTCAYHGRLDESNQLSIIAAFEVHVFADGPAIRVTLPVGSLNLGGPDACLVDGLPHPLLAAVDGRSVVLGLSGPSPAPDPPPVPQNDADDGPERESRMPTPEISGRRFRTHRVELQLQPPSEIARDNLSIATISIPATFRTLAIFSTLVNPAVQGLMASDANRAVQSAAFPSANRQVLRPNPTRQLVFYWSTVSGADRPPVTEAQADVSCLADLSPGFIQLRYHLAYRMQSGQLDSVSWYVPAGHVLQSVQAPQLSTYRFRPLSGGARDMLIEFSRPQAEDFSLTATFACECSGPADLIQLPLVDPLRVEDPTRTNLGIRLHQFALRQPSDWQVGIAAAASDQIVKPRSVDQFMKEWNPSGARPQQAVDLNRTFDLNLAIESKSMSPAIRGSSIGRIHSDRVDWNFSAEVEQPVIPRFVYRLQIDPRLQIRNVSVQEDGADRLLRWSRLRDTLILFLNDRATRTQTVRIEASMSLAAAQEIEVPRIRFVGAVPGPEKMILYRDPEVFVRLVNPEDFPLPTKNIADINGEGGQLVVRLDALPEQANPRIAIERLLPRVTAEIAVVLDHDAGAWQAASAIAFRVESGSVTDFAVDVPPEMSAKLEIKSTPPSHTTQLPDVDDRVKVLFHVDEPVKKQLIAVLTYRPDMSAGVWNLPQIRPQNAETTASRLIVPTDSIEPVDPALRPETTAPADWIGEIAPQSNAVDSRVYFWGGALPPADFRAARPVAESAIEAARLDLWLDCDGTIRGWLGLSISGNWPQRVTFNWPETCRPISLWVGNEFRSAIAGDSRTSHLEIPLPHDTNDKLIWLSWNDESKVHPLLTGRFAPRLPWPIGLPVQRCLANLHAPVSFRFEVPDSQSPSVVMPASQYFPQPISGVERHGESGVETGLWVLPQMPAAGTPLDLGASSLHVINDRSRQWILASILAACAWFVSWISAPLRRWVTHRETLAWLTLALVWWLWLWAGWLALAVVGWAGVRAVLFNALPQSSKSIGKTSETPSL